MTVAKAWDLQVAIYGLVTGVVSIPVFDHAPVDPPNEFIRLDGFRAADLSPKNGEFARHSFEIHHFQRPVSAQSIDRGQRKTKQTLAAVHQAIMQASFDGKPFQHEILSIEKDMDGITTHGMTRYSIIL